MFHYFYKVNFFFKIRNLFKMILNVMKISGHDNLSLVAISQSANDTAPWQPKPAYTHAYEHIFGMSGCMCDMYVNAQV